MPLHADECVIPHPGTRPLDRLRTELADLAFELERQGRLDAADVVIQVERRVRELADAADAVADPGPGPTTATASPPEPCARIDLST